MNGDPETTAQAGRWALVASVVGWILSGVAVAWALGDALPSAGVEKAFALKMQAIQVLIGLSAVASVGALALGVQGRASAPRLSVGALGLSSAWILAAAVVGIQARF